MAKTSRLVRHSLLGYLDAVCVDGDVAPVPREFCRRLGAPRLAHQLVVVAHHEVLGLPHDLHRLWPH